MSSTSGRRTERRQFCLYFASLLLLFLTAVSSCSGQGGRTQYYSLPPQAVPGEPLKTVHEILTQLGFKIGPDVDPQGHCHWFEDQEYIARYFHPNYTDLFIRIIQAVPSKQYCFAQKKIPYYYWTGDYTLPPGSSWKPGEHLFKRGILIIAFTEGWGILSPVKPFSSQASYLSDRMYNQIREHLGSESIHLFSEETRTKLKWYLAYE